MTRILRCIGLAALVAGSALVTGCATVTGSELQPISIEAVEPNGDPFAGADCNLSNDNGAWEVTSPGTIEVRRSAEDLVVRCQAEGLPSGTTRAVSRANAAMFGNLIFGGVIGAAIDHSRGTAYDYPTFVRVMFGANRVVEVGDIAERPAAPAPPGEQRGAAKLKELEGLLQDTSSRPK